MKRRGFIQSVFAGVAALFGVRPAESRGDGICLNAISHPCGLGEIDTPEKLRHFMVQNYRIIECDDGSHCPVTYALWTGGDPAKLSESIARTIMMKHPHGSTLYVRDWPHLRRRTRVLWGESIDGWEIWARWS